MSSLSSASTRVDDAATVEVVTGAGGDSGPPPSASTETANTHANAIANRRLFIFELPPFSDDDQRDSIVPIAADPESLFVQFWELHCAGEPHRALAVCDRLLEVIHPTDLDSHLRQTNGRGVALRALREYREAYRVHLAARPLLSTVKNSRLIGCHFHGLGMTLTELGEYVPAYKALETARDYYELANDEYRIGLVNVNTARLMVAAGRPNLAYELADAAAAVESLRVDAEIARALAHEAQGQRSQARTAIARAFSLLADSDNEATRAEALEVFKRIEGGRRDG